ncbi:hypothetical protein JANAI62_13210 [Jannaschia pagri]|uniref:Uncharacterized protein n=1 Tax=Jannaschia pagri TaxID=2829797 RepID=A0ABQ4NJU4_9RHOB|nr:MULTISPECIES: hypothetical protein [unclassified Jannaschia]GIT90867.1 hypothetical protein JANAI61_13250 [Jannaschia sp. AI_61]GIT94698.1 hypothetical protein JANAI62_13210 [Jannaschia sp. AI_62]
MTAMLKSALLVAALSAPLVGGIAPAAFGAESAATGTAQTLLTTKGDRGKPVHSPRAQAILASIAAESDN